MLMRSKTFFQGALVLTLSSLLLVQGALAQGRANRDEPAPTSNSIDERTGGIMQEAIEFLNAEQYPQARAKLGELNLERLSPYERSRVEMLYFNLDITDENYAGARQHMEAAINSGGMNDQDISQGRYQLAQLWMQEEKWAEGAAALEEWLKTEANPNGNVYYLIAVAYYRLENFDAALPHIRRAVDSQPQPREDWLQLLSAMLLQKEDYAGALPVVLRQVNMFPTKKQYWMQLSQIYAITEDYKNGLAVMQMAQHAGLLTEASEYQRLADMMMVQEMPYYAGTVMEKAINDKIIEPGLKEWETLGNMWVAAREFRKALPVYERAGDMADNGNNYLRVGEVNVQISEWEAASVALEKALDKGDLRDEAYAQFMLGTALYYQEKYSEAKTWFERSTSSANYRNNARGYIQVIDSKLN